MKAYLKNGRTIKISQNQADEIKNMKIKGKEDLLVNSFVLDPKKRVVFMIDVTEVIAIK
jgi:hypothetical protein